MLEAEWVVYRHRKNPELIATCSGTDWDTWVDYVFREVKTPAYEMVVRGLTESQAHQMVRIAVEE